MVTMQHAKGDETGGKFQTKRAILGPFNVLFYKMSNGSLFSISQTVLGLFFSFPDPFHSFSGYLTRNIETLNIQTCDHITIDVGLETGRVSIDNPQIADRYSVQWNPTM
jgi:hypothetical protein